MNWDGRGRPQGLRVKQYEPGYAVLRARIEPGTSLNAGESDRLTCYKAQCSKQRPLCSNCIKRNTFGKSALAVS